MQSIHIHEIYELIAQNQLPHTIDSAREVVQNFDAEQRFHSCSVTDLTKDTVIEFLSNNGKLSSNGNGGCACGHSG
ncbi:DUF2492 family protein [Teredinibacter sp. KSP-S5-2]|uniref:DUF2492 family protein n=1 Tax=Teredinibacter sp. KSP-S5-2 TaxID=3034506 RepID=UPI0029348A56|nr:DUF2492 family protein [Teredinibacter sp. KSP-S5-2]WNO10007.1 DUF2492 family protein [Teredinibacter sp. KSP-S5-2]